MQVYIESLLSSDHRINQLKRQIMIFSTTRTTITKAAAITNEEEKKNFYSLFLIKTEINAKISKYDYADYFIKDLAK